MSRRSDARRNFADAVDHRAEVAVVCQRCNARIALFHVSLFEEEFRPQWTYHNGHKGGPPGWDDATWTSFEDFIAWPDCPRCGRGVQFSVRRVRSILRDAFDGTESDGFKVAGRVIIRV